MIRITRNDDIAFNVNEVRGKGDRYKITFYTVNSAVNIQKTDQDVTNGIITLNGSELMTIGEGVMNFRVDNIAPNAGYNDGVFNSSFTRTTKYYIVSGVIIPDGEDTETVIDLISELQNSVSSEITRSTNKDNAHDAALANVYTKAEVDDMLDDIDVVLPDNIVIDANYNHTDNNFTTTEKTKLAGIANGAEVNVQSDWNVTNTSSDAYIKNKPTNVSVFSNDAGYLTSYTETDPTVPAWAKQSTKPTYTASEVGALPSSTVIPSKTSDLTNNSNFIVDANYVHTDNNFTTEEKNKLASIDGSGSGADGKQRTYLSAKRAGNYMAFKDSSGNTLTLEQSIDTLNDLDKEVIIFYQNKLLYPNSISDDGMAYTWEFVTNTHTTILTLSLFYDYDLVDDGIGYNYTTTNIPSIPTLGFGYMDTTTSSTSTDVRATTSNGFVYVNGGIVVVKFGVAVAASATLNVNSRGAKPIYYHGAAITAGVINSGYIATFVYYNNVFHLLCTDH